MRALSVGAGPHRTEEMSAGTAGDVIEFMKASGASVIDLTGGAPELNPEFPVACGRGGGARGAGDRRCNLTVLTEPGQADLAEFLADRRVDVVASLPAT